MAENLTPKKYIDSNNMKQILATVKNEIPIKVSELTNDSNYQTAEQVNSTVTTEIAKAVALGDKNFSTAPIGTVLSFAGQTAPHGYLLADGTSYKVADYPDLYAVIGNTYGGDTENFNVPDYRETVLVGVGENTTDTIASHDVYGLGEFKDDQLQDHYHNLSRTDKGMSNLLFYQNNGEGENWHEALTATLTGKTATIITTSESHTGRGGTTTHGKQKGVTYIIKAFHTNEGVDSGVSDDVINYVNDSLVDKQDFRIFKSLEEFNEKKGTSFTVVSGVDNMVDIANAMSEGDMLIITTKYNTGSEIYFGLDSSTGWTKIFTFIKANGLCDVECRTTSPSTFKRVLNVDGVIGTWQEIATMDKVAKYPDWSNQQTISLTEITVDQDVYIELNQLNTEPIEDLKINGKYVSVSDSENGLYSTRFSGYVKKGSVISYPYLTNPNIVRVFPLV